ncbi:hypothetical protein PFISCL1PPCAC_28177, partial [Pristionchus fissidentatus]
LNHIYRDRALFVTGASGFVGKVLVEKMLHSLPGIKTIFILIRASKGKSGTERWKDIEKLELFNRIRRDCPDRLSKVVAIEGDITLSDLGISQENMQRVLEETSVVIHCAATVRFNEPLKNAVEINMRGVSRVISLCHRMPKLACFLHCSTCYVNADKLGIPVEERVYPALCDPHKLMEASDWLDDSLFESIGESASKVYTNTYCFTKALSEHLVLDEASNLPTLILRPAIVGGIWKDGIPGWADAFQGIAALLAALGSGAISRVPVDLNSRCDAIPVDIVTNMMISAGAYRIMLKDSTIPILHCNSSDLNPMRFGDVRNHVVECAMKYPMDSVVSTPIFSPFGSDRLEKSMHSVREKYIGPAMDRITSIAGKKPFWARFYGRVGETYTVIRKFLVDYHFKSDNLVQLLKMMTEEDRETFDFDIRKLNWFDYMFDVQMGVKVFLLKDNIVDHEKVRNARRKMQLMQFTFTWTSVLEKNDNCLCIFRSMTSWHIFVPLTLVWHFYCTIFTYTPCGVASIHEYKRRIEDAMGETLK